MATTAPLAGALRTGIDDALAYLRTVDPDAAAELEAARRRDVTRPSVVVVGETKRGKSSLVNMLLGVPGLSPVDAAVATASYLEFRHADAPAARGYVPGRADPVPLPAERLRDWVTVGVTLPDGVRPPRRIEVDSPAPMLRYLTVVDTPGTGGLDPVHARIALDAVQRATALVFVVDASAPFAEPELTFLVEASTRVNAVVFVLAKIDAYPGWRTILADDQALLRAYAPRFAAAPWFPVSARLAELALGAGPDAATELLHESRIPPLQRALIDLAGQGHLLAEANVLRAVRSELVRLDGQAAERIRATDPDPAQAARLRAERAAVAARKRTESRQWSLTLSTETQRARVAATGLLRTSVAALQEEYLRRIDVLGGEQLRALPEQLDEALQALSIELSNDLEERFRAVGDRVLADVFDAEQRAPVLSQVNARLRHTLAATAPRDGGDHGLVVLSSAGMAVMAGRGAVLGASALGLGAGLIVPVVGLGLGVAAGAWLVWKRRAVADRQQARSWLREVLAEARAALTDEVSQRFTDLQYAITVALDEAIERRLQELDAHLAAIEQAMTDDQAQRARRRAALVTDRDALRAQVAQVDDVLVRVRQLGPAGSTDGQG